MKENKRAESGKCNHIDEPNHDRISCYKNTGLIQLIGIFFVAWIYSKI